MAGVFKKLTEMHELVTQPGDTTVDACLHLASHLCPCHVLRPLLCFVSSGHGRRRWKRVRAPNPNERALREYGSQH